MPKKWENSCRTRRRDSGYAKKIFLPQGGEIRFQNVQFSIRETDKKFKISISLFLLEKALLFWTYGFWKDNSCQTLLRFFNISSGTIFIDGQIYKCNTNITSKKNISIVPQMNSSSEVWQKILPSGKPGASRQEIETADTKAGAIDFISALPEGFNTLVGERGVKLSGRRTTANRLPVLS